MCRIYSVYTLLHSWWPMVTCLSSILIKNLRFRNLPKVTEPASGEARLTQCARSGLDFLLKELKNEVG